MLADKRISYSAPAVFFKDLWTFVRADRWLYLLIGAYCLAGSLFLLRFELFSWASFDIYPRKWFFLFAIIGPAIALLCDAIYVIHRFDHRRRLVFKRVYSSRRLAYLVSGVAFLMALSLFQSVFTALKTAFPIIQGGFHYDETHAALDRLIHFNNDPWRFLQPLLGHDSVRFFLEWNYGVVWFSIWLATLFFMATSPKAAEIRGRYLMCFLLVWGLIGTLLAGLFLSAGPIFYGLVTNDTVRFQDQLTFLARSGDGPHSVNTYANYLWSMYSLKSLGFSTGISAFPSVHVGITTLTAIFLSKMNRIFVMPSAAYVIIILLSSVYLGWHYAIDGYVSLVVTFLICAGVNKGAALIDMRRQRHPSFTIGKSASFRHA